VCGSDMHVKSVALGGALQLLQEHQGGEAPTSPSMVRSCGEVQEVYRELPLGAHPFIQRMAPTEALWRCGFRDRRQPCATSVELRRAIAAPWEECFGSRLPCSKDAELEIFAGALRRHRFTHVGGVLDVDHAELRLLNLAELVLQLGARQCGLNHETNAIQICEELCKALQLRQRAERPPPNEQDAVAGAGRRGRSVTRAPLLARKNPGSAEEVEEVTRDVPVAVEARAARPPVKARARSVGSGAAHAIRIDPRGRQQPQPSRGGGGGGEEPTVRRVAPPFSGSGAAAATALARAGRSRR